MSKKKGAEKQSFFKRTRKSMKLSFSELKKVHWPTRKETITYSWVVAVAVAIVGVLIWIADSGIQFLFKLFI